MNIALLVVMGLALNAAAALLALWRGSVGPGGGGAGMIVGTLIFACGGPLFWAVLVAFFVSSTAIGYIHGREKERLKDLHEKGSRRDALQVLANGGMGMLAALIFRLTSDPAWAAGFAVSFASATADTWASELGVLSRAGPVSLASFRPVPRGISGGISPLGILMSLAGAFVIAAIFAAFNTFLHAVPGGFMKLAAVVTAGGFAGSLLDSLLGATLQAQYAVEPSGDCPVSADMLRVTERSRSPQGLPNRLVRGLGFVNNDVVNFASCASVTLAAVLLAPVLF